MNYKAYQQVLNLAGEKKRTKPRQESTAVPKKRTRTGCMTCRRRKKKCDEEKTDGKCQACIRNFMDCCWPGHEETEIKMEPKEVPVPSKGASAYPSPILSPRAEAADEYKDIKSLSLPPPTFKVSKTKTPRKAPTKAPTKAGARFIVTSFDYENALCQIRT